MRSLPLLAFLFSTAALAQDANQRVQTLFKDAYQQLLANSPETASELGIPGMDDKWSDLSPAGLSKSHTLLTGLLNRLNGIDRSQLDAPNRLNTEIFQRFVQARLDSEEFGQLYMTTNQMSGVHLHIANTLDRAPHTTVQDYENQLARLRAAPQLLSDSILILRRGLAEKITPPRVVLRYLPDQLAGEAPENPDKSPLLEAFRKMPASIPPGDRDRLQSEAARVYREAVAPAFRNYGQFLTTEYIPKARETTSLSGLQNGNDWYATRLRLMTTTSLTADQIHEIGMNEVKRVEAQMSAIRDQLNFKGTLTEFAASLQHDPKFHYKTAAELLAGYRDIAKRADPEMVKLFGTLPRMPYGVLPIPSYQAEASAAHYTAPALDGSRPGYFWAKTYKPENISTFTMESLVMHEAVPGHHMQIALAQESPSVPDFRKLWVLSAFSEGWGLYAESLGEEIGFYADPYSKYGKLHSELFRSCRLVVDTGLHSKGWSRQQALDYFQDHLGEPLTSEIDRYIAWPGQAVSYKIGELKIKELRALAETSLGPKFRLKDFHDVVLGNGSLPLDLLEQQVKNWIASR